MWYIKQRAYQNIQEEQYYYITPPGIRRVDIEDKLVTLGLSCLHKGTMLDLTATES